MTHPLGTRVAITFFPGDLVRICIPAQANNTATPEMVLEGRVVGATDTTLSIVLKDVAPHSPISLSPLAHVIIQKSTSSGILELEATGRSHWDDEMLVLQVKLLGVFRNVQRRDSYRIELRSEVRYCDLVSDAEGDHHRNTAELHDISLGGISLLLRGHVLEIGNKVLIEFVLNDMPFAVSAAVRRVETRKRSQVCLCALEFLDLDPRQQHRMARAIVQLQVRLIGARVKTN